MSQTIESKKKSVFTPAFIMLIVAYTLACTGYQFIGTLFVSYGTEILGLDKVLVGSISGIIALAGLCMRPFSAVIVDKFNKKRMYAFSILAIGIVTAALSFVTGFQGMYVIQILRGICWALVTVSGMVMVSECVDKEQLGTATGFYLLSQVIANTFAATLALYIANKTSFPMAFRAGAAIDVLGAVIAFIIPIKASEGNKNASLKNTFKNLKLSNLLCVQVLPILVIALIFQVYGTAFGSYVVTFSRTELNLANVGIFATINSTIMWITRPLFGKIADKFGVKYCFIPGMLGYIVTSLVLAYANGMVSICVAAAIYGICSGGCIPVVQAVAIRAVDSSLKGAATSTKTIGMDIGLMFGNWVVPFFSAMSGSYRTSYLFLVVFGIVGLVYIIGYFWFYNKRHPGNVLGW